MSKRSEQPVLPEAPGFTGLRPTLAVVMRILRSETADLAHYHLRGAMNASEEGHEPYLALLNDPRYAAVAGAAIGKMMRQLVDMWVASGKSARNPGLDSPGDRNIEDVPTGYDSSLFEIVFDGILVRLGSVPFMWRDGTWEFQPTEPTFDIDFLQRLTWDDAAEEIGRRIAMYWFARLLNAPYARVVTRCDACGAYFVRRRARIVKNGVYCGKCQGKGSVKRTAAIRDSNRDKMLAAAAKAWGNWKRSNRHPDQRSWVAHEVNKQCGTEIGPKWASQNVDKILERVEALRNAQG